jgi:hypothetical protein
MIMTMSSSSASLIAGEKKEKTRAENDILSSSDYVMKRA